MNKQDKYSYWLDAAEYDIVTAESMLTQEDIYTLFLCVNKL